MNEREFQTKFIRWVKYIYKKTAVFELKLTKSNSLPFSILAPHQKEALLLSKHSILTHKIPDLGLRNPFDVFCVTNVLAFVVVMFYERGQKEFYLIDIDCWVKEEGLSKRKSLTKERAEQIGEKKILF